MAKRPPKGAKFEKTRVQRASYLRGVLGRLEHEVGIYFDLTREARQQSVAEELQAQLRGETPKGRRFPDQGYWAGVRLLMPVIESLAEIEGVAVTDFLRDHLGIKTPSLVWSMFRHALTHNDQVHRVTYGATRIRCGIGRGDSHRFERDLILIDVVLRYEDLRRYLQTKIGEGDEGEITIDTGLLYETPPADVQAEFAYLASQQASGF